MNRYFLSFFLLCFFFPATVFASGALVVPGTSASTPSSGLDYDTSDSLVVIAEVDRSVHCRAIPSQALFSLDFDPAFSGSGVPALTFRGTSEGGKNLEQAFSFISNSSDALVLGVAAVSPNPVNAQISCFETTLFGSFNTVNAANPVNFLEVSNISKDSVNFQVVYYSVAGAELYREVRNVPPLGRLDIGLQDQMALQNTFGSIALAHNGPLGAIKASLSKYTFDGGTLNITTTTSLSERVQN